MTTPATVRLVGLIVIVGTVAACGGEEATTPDSQKEREVAALTMDDVRALRREQSDLFSTMEDLRSELEPQGGWEDPEIRPALNELIDGQFEAMIVGQYSGMVEMAILRGDDRAARIWRDKALTQLELAREHLARAREQLGGE